MSNIELHQVLTARPKDVWQALSDIPNWARVFSMLQRVQVVNGDPSALEISYLDSAGRAWHEVGEGDDANQVLILSLKDGSLHPSNCCKQIWQVAAIDDEKTQVTLSCEFKHRLPVIGALIQHLSGSEERQQFVQNQIDALAHYTHQKKWDYHDTVQTILNHKGSDVISVAPEDSVATLCQKLHQYRIGAVLVLSPTGDLEGLVSERDVAYHIAQRGASILEQSAASIMTKDLIVCEPDSDVLFVMACMTDNKVRHLPVVKHGQLLGLISIGDVVQQRLKALQSESDTLREYIAAREWRYHNPHSSVDSPTQSSAK